MIALFLKLLILTRLQCNLSTGDRGVPKCGKFYSNDELIIYLFYVACKYFL